MRTTVKEFAAANVISASAARRRLEAMRHAGTAGLTTRWVPYDPPHYLTGCGPNPPAHRVNLYTIKGEPK